MTDQTIFERAARASLHACHKFYDGGADEALLWSSVPECSREQHRAQVRAVIQTIIDNTPSLRTAEELTRILGEA